MDELGKILQNYEEMYNSARVRFLNSHITLDQEHELFIMADKYARSAIIAWVEKEILPDNPYPTKIFTEPTKEQYALFHKILQEHGLTLDKFSGAFGRKVHENCLQEIKARLHG